MDMVDKIINVLGYSHSEYLFYRNDILHGSKIKEYLSSQTYRVLKELNPNAVFCADNRPFIAFFDATICK